MVADCFFVRGLLVGLFLFVLVVRVAGKREAESPADYDYEIYELIDRLNRLTPQHTTLYELLQVSPSATGDVVSRQFRRLSFSHHPDKSTAPQAREMFTLYSGAAQVLKSEEMKARYEWLLHDAPPWHRSQVYFLHKLKRNRRHGSQTVRAGPELTLLGTSGLLLALLSIAQFILQWTRFLVNRYWIWSGSRALRSIPMKEVRRMEKKALRSDLTFLAYVDSNFESMAAARSQPLPVPRPTDLFVIALPLAAIRRLVSVCLPKRKPEDGGVVGGKRD